jgi:DNA-binding transcriptional ArsR family regulator
VSAEPVDAALRALSHPVRRDLVRLCGQGERTVGELADLAGLRQPTTSQHLRVLRDAGLVRTEARGNKRLYRVDFQRLVSVQSALRDLWDTHLPRLKAAAEDLAAGDRTADD